MLQSRRSLRVFALVWALLQVALPAAMAVVDGAAVLRDGIDVSAHVEETSGKSCQPPHSAECATCRYLSVRGIDDGDAPELPWLFAANGLTPLDRIHAVAAHRGERQRARDPP